MQASVRVLKPDSTLLKGVLTNEDGAFTITFTISGINAGNYIVETSFVGYDSQSRNIKISNADITLKPIEMQAGALMLREAEVVGVRTPVKIMPTRTAHSLMLWWRICSNVCRAWKWTLKEK